MSPRNKIQNEAIRRASIDRIMDACLELFSRQGFAATSVNQIAKEAGVSKGLIYNYFESKEALIKEIVLDGMNKFLEIFDRNKDGILTSEEFIFFIERSFSSR